MPVAPVGLRLGVGVGELQHGAAEEHAGAQRAPRNQAADLRWRHVVPNEGDVAGAGVLQEVPGVALGSGVVLTAVEAVGGDLRVHFCRGVIGRQGVGDGRGDLGLRPVLGHVQGIDGPRHHGVDLGLREGFGLRVGVALELQRVRVVLQAGQQRAGEVQVPQHVAALQQLPGGRVGAPGRRVRQGHWRRVCLRRRVVRRQVDACYGGGNLSIHLRGSVVLQQGRGDCCACFCCSAAGRQRRCNGRISLCCCFVRHQRGCYRCVCLRNAVRVARQAQGEVVVLETHAEGRVEVQVVESVGAQQQVAGDLARPGLGVDQVAATAGGQGRQLREDGVYGALQAGFGGSQVGGLARPGPRPKRLGSHTLAGPWSPFDQRLQAWSSG